MKELHRSYGESTNAGHVKVAHPDQLSLFSGKTIHTWQIDAHPKLPLGMPALMMARQEEDIISEKLQKEYDTRTGYPVEDKGKHRATYLDTSYVIAGGCDKATGEFSLDDKEAKKGP